MLCKLYISLCRVGSCGLLWNNYDWYRQNRTTQVYTNLLNKSNKLNIQTAAIVNIHLIVIVFINLTEKVAYILLLKKACKDNEGPVSGYVSGHETSKRKALGSSWSPIWRQKIELLLDTRHEHLQYSDAVALLNDTSYYLLLTQCGLKVGQLFGGTISSTSHRSNNVRDIQILLTLNWNEVGLSSLKHSSSSYIERRASNSICTSETSVLREDTFI